ncbi:MAG: DUF6089 family protein, partial [Hymenobacteraceae bacterium]|nr:DUF6089 family protein [Hymenobacteraceae bacterium]
MTYKSLFTQILLVCSLQTGSIFFTRPAVAQNTSEIGIGIGGMSYRGEIAPAYRLQNNRPAFTLFYKKDISRPVTLGAGITYGVIRAQDEDLNLPLHQYRLAELKARLGELAV